MAVCLVEAVTVDHGSGTGREWRGDAYVNPYFDSKGCVRRRRKHQATELKWAQGKSVGIQLACRSTVHQMLSLSISEQSALAVVGVVFAHLT